MKVMSIDLGDVRTGVAVSDVTGFLAGRSMTITQRDRDKLLEEILVLIEKEKPGEVVLGLPVNMDGTEGPRAEKSRIFGSRLHETCGLPVKYMDERGSSISANRILSDAGKKRGKQRAEPRWLLPLICKAGDITKTDVGSIKILETETRFEITASKADAFLARIKQYGTGEKGVNITRSEAAGFSSPRSDFKPKKSFGEKREWDDRKPPRARDDRPRDDKSKADWAAKPAKAKPEGWTAEKPEKVKKPKERKPGDPSGFDKYKAKKARKAAAGQPE